MIAYLNYKSNKELIGRKILIKKSIKLSLNRPEKFDNLLQIDVPDGETYLNPGYLYVNKVENPGIYRCSLDNPIEDTLETKDIHIGNFDHFPPDLRKHFIQAARDKGYNVTGTGDVPTIDSIDKNEDLFKPINSAKDKIDALRDGINETSEVEDEAIPVDMDRSKAKRNKYIAIDITKSKSKSVRSRDMGKSRITTGKDTGEVKQLESLPTFKMSWSSIYKKDPELVDAFMRGEITDKDLSSVRKKKGSYRPMRGAEKSYKYLHMELDRSHQDKAEKTVSPALQNHILRELLGGKDPLGFRRLFIHTDSGAYRKIIAEDKYGKLITLSRPKERNSENTAQTHERVRKIIGQADYNGETAPRWHHILKHTMNKINEYNKEIDGLHESCENAKKAFYDVKPNQRGVIGIRDRLLKAWMAAENEYIQKTSERNYLCTRILRATTGIRPGANELSVSVGRDMVGAGSLRKKHFSVDPNNKTVDVSFMGKAKQQHRQGYNYHGENPYLYEIFKRADDDNNKWAMRNLDRINGKFGETNRRLRIRKKDKFDNEKHLVDSVPVFYGANNSDVKKHVYDNHMVKILQDLGFSNEQIEDYKNVDDRKVAFNVMAHSEAKDTANKLVKEGKKLTLKELHKAIHQTFINLSKRTGNRASTLEENYILPNFIRNAITHHYGKLTGEDTDTYD